MTTDKTGRAPSPPALMTAGAPLGASQPAAYAQCVAQLHLAHGLALGALKRHAYLQRRRGNEINRWRRAGGPDSEQLARTRSAVAATTTPWNRFERMRGALTRRRSSRKRPSARWPSASAVSRKSRSLIDSSGSSVAAIWWWLGEARKLVPQHDGKAQRALTGALPWCKYSDHGPAAGVVSRSGDHGVSTRPSARNTSSSRISPEFAGQWGAKERAPNVVHTPE